MRFLKYLFLFAIISCLFAVSPSRSEAQVSFSVNIGPAPVCPYGYFPYAPYGCAPYGYYGPTWFVNGFFIGAGPWFHGPRDFHGYVNHYYDPRFGYHGPYPHRGERADWGRHPDFREHFRGDSEYDGHGHDYVQHGNAYGHYKEHGNPHAYSHGNEYAHGNGHGNGHDNGHGNGHDNGHGNHR